MDRARLYAWFVICLTAIILGTQILSDASQIPSIATLVFWVGLLTAVSLLPVTLGFGTEVTMSFPIHLATVILFRREPWVAMAIAGIGAFDLRELRREIPFHRALFNRCQFMLAVSAASIPFAMLDPGRSPFSVTAVTVSAALYLVTNLGLVAAAVHFETSVPLWKTFRSLPPDPIAGFAVSYVLLTGLGTVSALAYERIAPWSVAAILIPLLFARLSILGARAQQELSEKLRKRQEGLLQATEKVFEERENERHRIAGDIHDTSLQMLAAAAYGCSNAAEFLDAGHQDAARDAMAAARDAIDGAMAGLRESLMDLRRSSVEEGGLLETVKRFAEQIETLWGTEVRIEGAISHEPPIPVALAAFQILQEGLVNAVKHAESERVIVKVNDDDGQVHIVVQDSGPGFDPGTEVGKDHVGMRLMHERAARVGGRIMLDSKPGSGTRLEAILPGGVAG